MDVERAVVVRESEEAKDVMWKRHFITDSYDTEGGATGDINGDGKPDLALAHYNHSGILWVDFSGSEPKVHHVGGKEQDGHGIGIADVDGDGKADILTPNGWFKNIDANNDKWEWHGDWQMDDAGFPIIGYDVNNDGKTDIIYGQGHSYGLYWLEQKGEGANRSWVKHAIDESYSQSPCAQADRYRRRWSSGIAGGQALSWTLRPRSRLL